MRIANASPVVTRRGPPLVLLALVTAIAPAALHMLVPALPMLAVVFDAAPGAVQLVLTLFLAGIAVGQLVYGPVSDRFGRRPVLLAGLTLFLVGTVLCGLAWSLPVLIVGRTLAAMGGCAGMVLGRAIVRDIYDRERSASALATIMMVMSLAPSLSPAIGAYLAQWVGWRADFVAARCGRGDCPGPDGGQARRDPCARIRQLRQHDRGLRPAAAVRRFSEFRVRHSLHQRLVVHLPGGGALPACRTAAPATEHSTG